MPYVKLFDPTGLEDLRTDKELLVPGSGDRRDGKIYVYDTAGEIVLAVNIALATGRPLLISGPSGSGKSSLAMHVARVLGRRYYEFVVTARAQAQDLTWRFDAVRRLSDAQVPGKLKTERELDDIYPYIEPQPLWWVYDRASAERRGRPATEELGPITQPKDPARWDPAESPKQDEGTLPAEVAARLKKPQVNSSVLLVDEIDKADPDVPNNLLVELGSRQFDVDLIRRTINFTGSAGRWEERPLVMITTNKERPLPQPFIRRCVVLEIPKPKRGLLRSIARRNLPRHSDTFFDLVLDAVLNTRGTTTPAPPAGPLPVQGTQAQQSAMVQNIIAPAPAPTANDEEVVDVSIAEYVDTLRACSGLSESHDAVDQALLTEIIRRTVWTIKERAVRPQ